MYAAYHVISCDCVVPRSVLPLGPRSGMGITSYEENTNKSSHSTCSDGSLLSMGSSEMDEDSFGPGSRHSSKLSLHEKKSLVSSDASPSHVSSRSALDFGGGGGSAPLSHSAAKHKMAVRPKRTYGAPRRSRIRQMAATASVLPVTPELNEDGSARSTSPEPPEKRTCSQNAGAHTLHNGKEGVGSSRFAGTDPPTKEGGNRSASTDLPDGKEGVGKKELGGGRLESPVSNKDSPLEPSDAIDAACMMTSPAAQPTSVQLKSASLPLGMTAPGLSGWSDPTCKLSRSKSSAADRKQPLDAASVVESEEELPKKEDTSFFGRLLSRRSGKKKKNSVEEQPAALELPQKRMDDKGRYVQEPLKLTRNHPASRQRVEPISIPSEPCSVTRMHVSYSAPTSSTIPEPEKPFENPHQHIFKPTNRVIPDDIDLELQRRSLVKKSHSFRLTTSDDAAPKSLDPTILISTKSSSSVILSSSPPTDTINPQPNNKSPDVVVDDKIGALNRNLVDDITGDMSETKSESCSSVYIKSVLLPCCPDDDNVIESVTVEKEAKHTPTKVWDDEITVNNESVPAPLSHQITIPVNASVVSIVDTDKVVENSGGDCLDEVEMDIADLSDEVESSVPASPVKPEPRQKTSDDLTFFPVPAPRISKRESAPVEIPEFMKVQLNRFDGRKLSNVILSTSPNTIFKQDNVSPTNSPKSDDVVPQETLKADESVIDNVIGTKDVEELVNDKNVNNSAVSTRVVEDLQNECESNDEKMNSNSLEEFGNNELEVEVNVSPAKTTIDNTPKVVELKQWSSTPTQVVTGIPPRPVPNPRYSIVSITASKGSEASNQSEPPKNQTAGQIVRKKSIVKDVIAEQNHRKADQDRDVVNEKDNNEPPVLSKPIPRKKSFNTDEKSGMESIGVSQLKQLPRIFTKHNNRATENQWNRKSSFEEFNDRIVGEQNGKNRSKDDENVRERNSIGSCDTLSMQESPDVVMRRKPLSREVTRQNDDEPELLKVFARRSLKVKDCDLPSDLEIAPEPSTKSRDSDKENECGDSPPEERKKIKEAFVDTKDMPKPSSVAKTQKIILSTAGCEDASDVLLKENNQTSYEKRQRSRTFPDNQKILEPPKRPVTQRVLQDVLKEKDVEVISLEGSKGSSAKNSAEVNENNNNSENDVPLFKRIQQRKEEWEKRAQLAAVKRNHP